MTIDPLSLLEVSSLRIVAGEVIMTVSRKEKRFLANPEIMDQIRLGYVCFRKKLGC